MANPTQKAIAREILDSHGQTYAAEIGISLKNTPAPLYQLLNASLLLSARIAAGNAVEASSALLDAKLNTPQKMASATWQRRVDAITDRGYKRYDESTATMLGETAELLLDRYDGDLRNLRSEAASDVSQLHKLLQQFKGIGSVGASIFLREVQEVWHEVFPYADDRVAKAAKKLDLPQDANGLAKLVNREDFPRLVAGMVRVDLAKEHQKVLEQAA